jgi:hypothetical protein
MAKIEAQRMAGNKLVTGIFSEQVWESGYPKKAGWERIGTVEKTVELPETLKSKSSAMKDVPAADIAKEVTGNASDEATAEEVKAVPQLDELRATAKALKIKGSHLMKEDALIAAIEKAKA